MAPTTGSTKPSSQGSQPDITHSDRRLRGGDVGGCDPAVAGGASAKSAVRRGAWQGWAVTDLSPTLLAQLTDTHVVDADSDEVLYVDNNERVRIAVESLNAESPALAAVVATGDLTQWGSTAEFDQLVELVAPLRMPFLPLPGNHDHRDRLRSAFPNHPWVDDDHASWVQFVDGVRIVGLDTTVPGQPGGLIDDQRATWLSSALADPHDGVTILAMHHPPFETGIGWMDRSGLSGRARLEAVLRDQPHVDRIWCGHLHRPITSVVGGVPAEVGLSTTVHVALDLAPGAVTRVVRDPAGYRVHMIGDGTIVSHTRYIDTGEDPFAPAWAESEG